MGYDPARFDGSVDDELKCPICCYVLQDAVQAPDCEHTFCQECINEWLTRQTNCPVDRQPLTRVDLKPAPRVLRNFLAKLDIKCDFSSSGCTTITKLELLQSHCDSCDYNPYKPVICEKGCGLVLLRNQVDEHNCLSDLRELVSSQQKQINELKNYRSAQTEQIADLKRDLKRVQDHELVEHQRQLHNLQQQCNRLGNQLETLQKQHQYLQQQQSLALDRQRCHSPNPDEDDCDCDNCDPQPRPCVYSSGIPRKRLHSWKDLPAKRLPSCSGGKPCLSSDAHERSAPSPYTGSDSDVIVNRHNYYHHSASTSSASGGHNHSYSHIHSPAQADRRNDDDIPTDLSTSGLHQQLITFYGSVITLSLSEDELVEHVKGKIEHKECIPADQQLLFFAGQQLEDDKQLAHYQIPADQSRHLVLRLRDGMKIYVETLSNKVIEVQVDPSETIEIVKVKIHEQEGISPCDQRLLLDDRDLADLRTLSDYGIKHKSTLKLDLHLGGPCPICQSQFKNNGQTATGGSGGGSPRSSGKGASIASPRPHSSGKHD